MEHQTESIRNYFSELEFKDSTHNYFIGDKKLRYSVSGIVSKFAERFDKDNISRNVAAKEGVTQQEVLDRWKKIADDACDRGNNAHLFGELYVKSGFSLYS